MDTRPPENSASPAPPATDEARRKFLATCGKFALVTPPAMALILADSERNYAVALSGGYHHVHHHHGNNGFGNGGHDGVPGHSGFSHSRHARQMLADRDR